LLLVGLLLLVGCTFLLGGSQESATSGTLTIYTTLSQAEADAYLADFAIAYPDVTVTLVRTSTAALIDRVRAERSAPQADVIWSAPLANMLLFEWSDLLRPYAPLGLSRVESHFRDTRTPPYWVGSNLIMAAFCVNPRMATARGFDLPTSWADLLQPTYRRNVVMPSPLTSATGYMTVIDILQRYGEQDGWRYLDELHKNIALYTQTDEEACTLVSSEEYPVGIGRYVDGLANVEFVYPTEGSGWEILTSALVRKNPIKPAAVTFLDWAISENAMRIYARRAAVTAVKTGLPVPLGFPSDPEAYLQKLDLPWAAANRNRILTEWVRRYGDKVVE
jgi:iron(III) transport system substrate-binding protein